jgi:hypothetical protein
MRNRHSGRVNAAKQHVLMNGTPFMDSKGNTYSKMQTGVRGTKEFQVPVFSIVRVATCQT